MHLFLKIFQSLHHTYGKDAQKRCLKNLIGCTCFLFHDPLPGLEFKCKIDFVYCTRDCTIFTEISEPSLMRRWVRKYFTGACVRGVVTGVV